jgi:RimJ/RimL family protein N-acetyltransferase
MSTRRTYELRELRLPAPSMRFNGSVDEYLVMRIRLGWKCLRLLRLNFKVLLHFLCKQQSAPMYYLVYLQGSNPVFRTLVHSCTFRFPFTQTSTVSFSDVFTTQQFRNQGIAYCILRQEIGWIQRNHKITSIHWVCRVDNAASQALAHKLGFTQLEVLKEVKSFFVRKYLSTSRSSSHFNKHD